MESLLTGAEAWLSETGKLAATWLGDDPEETEAHVHMRHARQVAIALERGAEPPPAPTVAPRYAPRDGDASGAEQSGMSDADGLEGGAKSKRRWRERPPPGSPAARAERARLVSDFREVVPSARILSADGAVMEVPFLERETLAVSGLKISLPLSFPHVGPVINVTGGGSRPHAWLRGPAKQVVPPALRAWDTYESTLAGLVAQCLSELAELDVEGYALTPSDADVAAMPRASPRRGASHLGRERRLRDDLDEAVDVSSSAADEWNEPTADAGPRVAPRIAASGDEGVFEHFSEADAADVAAEEEAAWAAQAAQLGISAREVARAARAAKRAEERAKPPPRAQHPPPMPPTGWEDESGEEAADRDTFDSPPMSPLPPPPQYAAPGEALWPLARLAAARGLSEHAAGIAAAEFASACGLKNGGRSARDAEQHGDAFIAWLRARDTDADTDTETMRHRGQLTPPRPVQTRVQAPQQQPTYRAVTPPPPPPRAVTPPPQPRAPSPLPARAATPEPPPRAVSVKAAPAPPKQRVTLDEISPAPAPPAAADVASPVSSPSARKLAALLSHTPPPLPAGVRRLSPPDETGPTAAMETDSRRARAVAEARAAAAAFAEDSGSGGSSRSDGSRSRSRSRSGTRSGGSSRSGSGLRSRSRSRSRSGTRSGGSSRSGSGTRTPSATATETEAETPPRKPRGGGIVEIDSGLDALRNAAAANAPTTTAVKPPSPVAPGSPMTPKTQAVKERVVRSPTLAQHAARKAEKAAEKAAAARAAPPPPKPAAPPKAASSAPMPPRRRVAVVIFGMRTGFTRPALSHAESRLVRIAALIACVAAFAALCLASSAALLAPCDGLYADVAGGSRRGALTWREDALPLFQAARAGDAAAVSALTPPGRADARRVAKALAAVAAAAAPAWNRQPVCLAAPPLAGGAAWRGSALAAASGNGHASAVDALLAAGADVAQGTSRTGLWACAGVSPLADVASRPDAPPLAVVAALAAAGGGRGAPGRWASLRLLGLPTGITLARTSPLGAAAKLGTPAALRTMLRAASPPLRLSDGRSVGPFGLIAAAPPLYDAAGRGAASAAPAAVEALLKAGAPPTARASAGPFALLGSATALHAAAIVGDSASITALLAAGADAASGLRFGPWGALGSVAPLGAIASRSHTGVAEALLRAAPDAAALPALRVGPFGILLRMTPLGVATRAADVQMMGVLLKAGATPAACARLLLLVRLDCRTLVRGGGAGLAPAALLQAWHAKQRMAQEASLRRLVASLDDPPAASAAPPDAAATPAPKAAPPVLPPVHLAVPPELAGPEDDAEALLRTRESIAAARATLAALRGEDAAAVGAPAHDDDDVAALEAARAALEAERRAQERATRGVHAAAAADAAAAAAADAAASRAQARAAAKAAADAADAAQRSVRAAAGGAADDDDFDL